MTIFEAVVFGVLQGLTEFLPVSSSGHLAVLKELWGYGDITVLFDILLHAATLAAVLLVFRKRIWGIIRSIFRWLGRRATDTDTVNLRLSLLLIIATVITAALGIAIEEVLQPGDNIALVSALFIVTAVILILTRFVPQGKTEYPNLPWHRALILGFAQGLGVFPGISRSGITISGALFLRMTREQAGEFSFLLSIPAILGAAVLKIGDLGSLNAIVGTGSLIAGMLAALISGLAALTLLLHMVRRGSLHLFAFYLIPLGILGLIFL